MLLSSNHWFLVIGTGTFQLLMMMVVALFALQSSMAHPSVNSSFRPSIHEYQEKKANRSALTLSGSLANTSQLHGAPVLMSAFSSGNYSNRGGDHSCVGKACSFQIGNDCSDCPNTLCQDLGECDCIFGFEPNSDKSGCVRVTNPTTPSTSSTASTPSTSSSPGTPNTSSTSNTPSTSSIPTTASSIVSTSPSTTTSTELPSTKTKTSYGSSKRTVMIVGIVVMVSMLAITLLYIFGCHFCRTEAKIGDTSGANYRRQAYQPSPANSKATTKANSKVSSNANSKATSKATSKITSKFNSAKTSSKH